MVKEEMYGQEPSWKLEALDLKGISKETIYPVLLRLRMGHLKVEQTKILFLGKGQLKFSSEGGLTGQLPKI